MEYFKFVKLFVFIKGDKTFFVHEKTDENVDTYFLVIDEGLLSYLSNYPNYLYPYFS